MLALDLPDTVAVFNHDNANKFGGWEALQKQGIENLRSLEIEQLETLPAPGGGTFNALLGESVYTASRFWWNGTSYEQLTHVRPDGTLTLDISPGFQAVLAAIIMDR
jgi:hypothetical protein